MARLHSHFLSFRECKIFPEKFDLCCEKHDFRLNLKIKVFALIKTPNQFRVANEKWRIIRRTFTKTIKMKKKEGLNSQKFQDFICSLAHFTFMSGVQKLSLCDPWNSTAEKFHEFNCNLAKTLAEKHGLRLHNGTLEMEQPKMRMKLGWLRADEWKNTLVQACIKV